MNDDDLELLEAESFVPWPLIGNACKDAVRMWRHAWPCVLLYALLQSCGIAAAYQLIVRLMPSTAPGSLTLAIVGAFLCIIAGGLAGAPLARFATLAANNTEAPAEVDFHVLRRYQGAGDIFRASIVVLAALLIGLLASAFVLTMLGAILCTAGGIIGSVIVAIAGLIVLPLIGVLFFPMAHFLWAAACLQPHDPRRLLADTRAAFDKRSARGDSFIWGAGMMVLSVATITILLVIFSATALIGNFVLSLVVGTLLLTGFMSVQWALAIRFYRVLWTRVT